MLGRTAISALILMASATAALATTVSLTLTNRSGDTVSAVTVLPKDAIGVEPAELLAAPIPPDSEASVTIETAEGQCLFDFSITGASGKVSDMPDVDICQTDGIIIE